MRRIAFVTGHYSRSHRKGGIHWLAQSFQRAGWDVLFFTSGLSYLSRLRKDHRFQFPVMKEANRVVKIEDRFSSFVWFTAWHPVDLGWDLANLAARPFFDRYGELPLHDAEAEFAKMDVIVIESGLGLLLVDRLKRINPSARFVYRLSDNLRVLRVNPLVVEAEKRSAQDFDLITTPSPYLLRGLEHLRNTAVHPQGLDKRMFDSCHQNPYLDSAAPNLISIGNMLYDLDFLERASRMFPEWRFHVIGWLKKVPHRPNVIFYGEKPFKDTIPFVKYADIGLCPYRKTQGNEYLSQSSHKILQYTYCRLPIVAPHSVTDRSRPHLLGYMPGDDGSIREALEGASKIAGDAIDTSSIRTWDEIVQDLLRDLRLRSLQSMQGG